MRHLFCIALAIIALLCGATDVRSNSPKDSLAAALSDSEKALRELIVVSVESVPTFRSALEAHINGDFTTAARLYREVVERVPHFAPAVLNLGVSLAGAGRADEGVPILDSLLMEKRTPEHLYALALVLYEHNYGTATHEITRAQAALPLAREAATTAGDKKKQALYAVLFAECAFIVEDQLLFREAVELLQAVAPGEAMTHYLSAILAVSNDDLGTADEELQLAVAKGVRAERAEQFAEDSGIARYRLLWNVATVFFGVVVFWGLGLSVLFIAGRICSRAIMRVIEQGNPEELFGERERQLRHFYKRLIAVASGYYYVSLPIVSIGVLGLAVGFLLLCLSAGRIPVYLVLMVGIGSVVTVYHMARTPFIKIKHTDIGRLLLPEEAPGLWECVREVAAIAGTRPVDEIRIEPGTEIAVYERGTARERASDSACRVLLLGIGVLDGFRKDGFRAVIAHEYGHFANRDTAGGEAAMRVGKNMENLFVAMMQSGQTVWWNIGFWFLRLYHALFIRLSYGATRLQEVMADHKAVMLCGADAFKTGLHHVLIRSVEFNVMVNREMKEAIAEHRPLRNIYNLQVQSDEEQQEIEALVVEALSSTTSDIDTHPAPIDRFRMAEKVQGAAHVPVSGYVWEFFPNRDALTVEMNKVIRHRVNANSGFVLPVED